MRWLVNDVEELRRALRVDTMAVAAHDWGGIVSWNHAHAYPERVDHRVMQQPAPGAVSA